MARKAPLPKLGPKVRASEAAPAVLAARLADVRHQEPALARAQPAPDAVHDMRVAARRLRAALKLFELPDSLGAEVKRLQDSLGAVRDVQVQAEWLAKALRTLPANDRAAIAGLRLRLVQRLDPLGASLQQELLRWRTATVPLLAQAGRAAGSKRRLGGKRFRRQLQRRLRRVLRSFAQFEKSDLPSIAHRLRIAAKKLRYEAELFEEARPKTARALVKRLQPLRKSLGDLHDADVRISLLEQQIGVTPAADGALRRLAGRERGVRRRLASTVRRAIGRWG